MRSVAAVLVVLAAAVAASGCGEAPIVKGGDASRGKQLFVSKCGSCHTLADAGTQGAVGPNLDAAFAGPRAQGFKESTIRQIVRDQIEQASCVPSLCMPKNLVTGQDANSVATYVASVAGTTPAAAAAAPPTSPPPSGGGSGAALYSSLGCSSCHSLTGAKGTGPTFKGLYGSKVTLATGQTVTANDAYLIESILDPDKQIVKGYQKGIMSATIKPHSVPQAKAKQLVEFLRAQR